MAMLNTDPEDIIAQLAPAGPDTNTGDETGAVLLLPTWPEPLLPQAYKRPALVRPTACSCPSETAAQLVEAGPDTSMGEDTDTMVAIPA